MQIVAPPQLPVGPPAEVYIYVLPPVPGGRYSLRHHPRRTRDTVIHFTHHGHTPTDGKSREVMWIPSGLVPGQTLLLQEKTASPGRGHFAGQPFRIVSAQPFELSGPATKCPGDPRESTWEYEIVLSDKSGILARLDPDVVIIDDP